MSAAPPLPTDGTGVDASPDSAWVARAVGSRRRHRPRLPVDRVRGLLLLGLLGAAVVVFWLRWLASEPHWPLVWQADDAGGITLQSSTDPNLREATGQHLQALVLADGEVIEASAALLPRSPRWVVDDAERERQQAMRARISQAVQQARVTVHFESGLQRSLAPHPRGLSGLGGLCWGLCALALALYLAGMVTVLAQPSRSAALFGVLALSQCLNLLLIAAESLPGMGLPPGLVRVDFALRLLADATSAAALVQVLTLYPRRLPGERAIALLAWGVAALSLGWMLLAAPAGLWWWAQGQLVAYGLVAALLLRPSGPAAALTLRTQTAPLTRPATASQTAHPARNPLATLLQRLVLAGTGTLVLLNLAMVTAGPNGAVPYQLASIGSVVWYVFFASLLMLAPFLSRSRQVMREFMLLAGVATVATSLDLLFLAIFGLHPLAALVLAIGVSLGVYALARPWVLAQLAGSGAPSAERMFDSLYRAARALEQSPSQASQQLAALLREVFDPLEVARSGRAVSKVRVAPDGSTLVVPVPHLPGSEAGTVVLRFARRGRRLFTEEDRQLCERLLEQLRRAVAYDRAVEHGRTEERARIAQDLHDDIGARLLTLMYKAPNEEIEEYIRHTLQDLKTLTRGLAASNHRLSHAAAEWKADITQRLQAAGCDLHWSFSTDRDLTLSVVQWSGLTRVLRELVNNIITHAQATQVEISLMLDHGRLTLQVSDDGIGSAPAAWSHGLGLGGVRKRVKLLGGQVTWVEREGRGIRCEVLAPLASEGDNGAA